VQTAPCYVPSFWHNTGVWRTDGQTDRQTDRQTDGIVVASAALAMRASLQKSRVLYIWQECKWGAPFPSLGRSACRSIYDRSCDARLVQSQTYGYLPSAENCHCTLISTYFHSHWGQEAEWARWLVTYRGCILVNCHASQSQTLSTNRGPLVKCGCADVRICGF